MAEALGDWFSYLLVGNKSWELDNTEVLHFHIPDKWFLALDTQKDDNIVLMYGWQGVWNCIHEKQHQQAACHLCCCHRAPFDNEFRERSNVYTFYVTQSCGMVTAKKDSCKSVYHNIRK
jgi:hypothetical protein